MAIWCILSEASRPAIHEILVAWWLVHGLVQMFLHNPSIQQNFRPIKKKTAAIWVIHAESYGIRTISSPTNQRFPQKLGKPTVLVSLTGGWLFRCGTGGSTHGEAFWGKISGSGGSYVSKRSVYPNKRVTYGNDHLWYRYVEIDMMIYDIDI